jgi:hypothetical protein
MGAAPCLKGNLELLGWHCDKKAFLLEIKEKSRHERWEYLKGCTCLLHCLHGGHHPGHVVTDAVQMLPITLH